MQVAEKNSPTLTPSPVDYYQMDAMLTPEERDVRARVRYFVQSEVEPIINDYWERGEFPMQIVPKLAALGIVGGFIKGYGCPGLSNLGACLATMELSRGDGSVETFFGVHSGLAMGSIAMLGSEEQKQKWLPPMARMEKLGCFGLTEPGSGSDASHPASTARRDGDEWVLNGQKRWIGGAMTASVSIIYAKNEETGQVNGFVVELPTPGFTVTPITGKIAKRALINCDITMNDVRIPLDNKLANANSFRDTAKVLMATRIGVAWQAIGTAMAAYEYALDYAKKRVTFGKPIAGYQMIQEKLVKMLGSITAMQMMTLRLSQLADEGKMTEGMASLAKVFNCQQAREVVAMAREILGGNGILLENHVARHFADMEAVYTYEGTNEINTLVVGREITGIQAIV